MANCSVIGGSLLANIDPTFMRKVQDAGWRIIGADQLAVWVSCPREGCELKTRFKPGGSLPSACARGPDLATIYVDTFDDARIPLRQRREELGLIIKDIEDSAGIADDFLSKFEKDEPSKIPNAQTFFEWCAALGYQVVLQPAPLTPRTMRLISESRDKQDRREIHRNTHAKRRAQKAAKQGETT